MGCDRLVVGVRGDQWPHNLALMRRREIRAERFKLLTAVAIASRSLRGRRHVPPPLPGDRELRTGTITHEL